MEETVRRHLANTIGKTLSLLTCPSVEQTIGQKALPKSAPKCHFYLRLHKLHYRVDFTAQKSNTSRSVLLSFRVVLILMSLCLASLLSLSIQTMTTPLALAAGGNNASGSDIPDPNGFVLYKDGFCQDFTHEEVPQVWATQLCNNGQPIPNPDSMFVKPGNGPCQQSWLQVMSQTGQQECILTVPSLRSQCPVGFALDGGQCDYEPYDRTGWQVGFCESFQTGEVPVEWMQDRICQTDPSIPDPEQTFVQDPQNNVCPTNWLLEMTQTAQQKCVLAVPAFRNACPVGFALDGGLCHYQTHNSGRWLVGFCKSFSSDEVPPEWVNDHICQVDPVIPDPEQTFVQNLPDGACPPSWLQVMTQTAQQKCVLTVPAFKGTCPITFVLDNGLCQYKPQNSGIWQVGFCKSFSSNEVPPDWVSNHVCDIDPIPDPQQTFVQPLANTSCPENWIQTTTQTAQQECVLTVPAFRGTCPIGFTLDRGSCDYTPPNSGNWRSGLCASFSSDEIPLEWMTNHVCDTTNPEQTFIQPGPCQPNWIATTAQSSQFQCLLTVPDVRGLCPIGFALDGARCDYVPQSRTSWKVGFCLSFSSDEIPPEWNTNNVCSTNPIPDPQQAFIKPGPCQPNWIETISQTGQPECILTLPNVRGLCPISFVLNGAKCDYVPQNETTWVVGFCTSFTSNAVPAEWIRDHICDTNPIPDPEQTFVKSGPCLSNWVRTAAEGGDTPKCVLVVPAIRQQCPIGFALDEASCTYVPRHTAGWQFPCSDLPNGTPNEPTIARDWLSGNSPDTQQITSNPAVTDGKTGGRFEHTFAADTYGLKSMQELFGFMLGLAFVLITPMLILIGYHIMLAASSFRHAGVLEGLSRVILGVMAMAVSFQLIIMLITFTNTVSGALVNLHGMLGYPATQIDGVKAAYTLAGAHEPLTSYRGMVIPMSRWGCAINDFIGILGNRFFSDQVTPWFPVIGNLAPLSTQVTNGAELASRLAEFARLVLSVALWLQAVIRLGLLNCYILTCPLALACWALPGGLGQQVVRQWTRGFFAVLALQVIQLFFMTTLPLILPSFPDLADNTQGIMAVLLTQLPPLLVLWLTVRVPKLVGISVSRAIGMTGVMAGEIVGAVGAAASMFL